MPFQRDLVYAIALAALRIAAVPCALIWLLGHVGGLNWSHASVGSTATLISGILINQLALGIFAARMLLILRMFEIQLGWIAAMRIHLQSMFYFFVLPMTVGLEIARFIKIRASQPTVPAANLASALLLDRLLGAGSALALAILCAPLTNIRFSFEVSSTAVAFVAAGALLACGALAIWRPARHVLQRTWKLTEGRRANLAALFALSVIMHVLFAAGVKLLGNGLGLTVALADTMLAVAGGMLLVVIPVSLAGLGPAEAGAAAIFLALGYDASVAVAAGALPYFARLIGAVEGGVWEMVEGGASALAATRRATVDRPVA